jgi:hypothetical protein
MMVPKSETAKMKREMQNIWEWYQSEKLREIQMGGVWGVGLRDNRN